MRRLSPPARREEGHARHDARGDAAQGQLGAPVLRAQRRAAAARRCDAGKPTRFAKTAAAWGEPVPKTVAAARRIAAKGKRLLAAYARAKASKTSMTRAKAHRRAPSPPPVVQRHAGRTAPRLVTVAPGAPTGSSPPAPSWPSRIAGAPPDNRACGTPGAAPAAGGEARSRWRPERPERQAGQDERLDELLEGGKSGTGSPARPARDRHVGRPVARMHRGHGAEEQAVVRHRPEDPRCRHDHGIERAERRDADQGRDQGRPGWPHQSHRQVRGHQRRARDLFDRQHPEVRGVGSR